jgi:hypothetical protein
MACAGIVESISEMGGGIYSFFIGTGPCPDRERGMANLEAWQAKTILTANSRTEAPIALYSVRRRVTSILSTSEPTNQIHAQSEGLAGWPASLQRSSAGVHQDCGSGLISVYSNAKLVGACALAHLSPCARHPQSFTRSPDCPCCKILEWGALLLWLMSVSRRCLSQLYILA